MVREYVLYDHLFKFGSLLVYLLAWNGADLTELVLGALGHGVTAAADATALILLSLLSSSSWEREVPLVSWACWSGTGVLSWI